MNDVNGPNYPNVFLFDDTIQISIDEKMNTRKKKMCFF